MSTPFDILGVSRDASDQEIKKAYKKKAKELHPDVNSSDDAKTKFQILQHAYSLLTDPISRIEYLDSIKSNDPFEAYMAKMEAIKKKIAEEKRLKEEAFKERRKQFRKSPWYRPAHVGLFVATTLSYLTGTALLLICAWILYDFHPMFLFVLLPVLSLGVFLLVKTRHWFNYFHRYFESD